MVQICKLSVVFYDNTPTCCPEVLLNTESITRESREIRDNAHLFDCAPCMKEVSHSWATELVASQWPSRIGLMGAVPVEVVARQATECQTLPTCYSEAPVLALPPIDV